MRLFCLRVVAILVVFVIPCESWQGIYPLGPRQYFSGVKTSIFASEALAGDLTHADNTLLESVAKERTFRIEASSRHSDAPSLWTPSISPGAYNVLDEAHIQWVIERLVLDRRKLLKAVERNPRDGGTGTSKVSLADHTPFLHRIGIIADVHGPAVLNPLGGFDPYSIFSTVTDAVDAFSFGKEDFGNPHELYEFLKPGMPLLNRGGYQFSRYDASDDLSGRKERWRQYRGMGALAVTRILTFLRGRITGIFYFTLQEDGEPKFFVATDMENPMHFVNAVVEFEDVSTGRRKRYWYLSHTLGQSDPAFQRFIGRLNFQTLFIKAAPEGELRIYPEAVDNEIIGPAVRNGARVLADRALSRQARWSIWREHSLIYSMALYGEEQFGYSSGKLGELIDYGSAAVLREPFKPRKNIASILDSDPRAGLTAHVWEWVFHIPIAGWIVNSILYRVGKTNRVPNMGRLSLAAGIISVMTWAMWPDVPYAIFIAAVLAWSVLSGIHFADAHKNKTVDQRNKLRIIGAVLGLVLYSPFFWGPNVSPMFLLSGLPAYMILHFIYNALKLAGWLPDRWPMASALSQNKYPIEEDVEWNKPNETFGLIARQMLEGVGEFVFRRSGFGNPKDFYGKRRYFAANRSTFFTRHFPVKSGDRVLDWGAGTAVNAIYAASAGAGEVIAIEKRPDCIQLARLFIAKFGLENKIILRQSDGYAAIESWRQFDLIGFFAPPYTNIQVSDEQLFDSDGHIIELFFSSLAEHLAPKGRVALMYPDNPSAVARIESLAARSGLKITHQTTMGSSNKRASDDAAAGGDMSWSMFDLQRNDRDVKAEPDPMVSVLTAEAETLLMEAERDLKNMFRTVLNPLHDGNLSLGRIQELFAAAEPHIFEVIGRMNAALSLLAILENNVGDYYVLRAPGHTPDSGLCISISKILAKAASSLPMEVSIEKWLNKGKVAHQVIHIGIIAIDAAAGQFFPAYANRIAIMSAEEYIPLVSEVLSDLLEPDKVAKRRHERDAMRPELDRLRENLLRQTTSSARDLAESSIALADQLLPKDPEGALQHLIGAEKQLNANPPPQVSELHALQKRLVIRAMEILRTHLLSRSPNYNPHQDTETARKWLGVFGAVYCGNIVTLRHGPSGHVVAFAGYQTSGKASAAKTMLLHTMKGIRHQDWTLVSHFEGLILFLDEDSRRGIAAQLPYYDGRSLAVIESPTTLSSDAIPRDFDTIFYPQFIPTSEVVAVDTLILVERHKSELQDKTKIFSAREAADDFLREIKRWFGYLIPYSSSASPKLLASFQNLSESVLVVQRPYVQSRRQFSRWVGQAIRRSLARAA